MFKKKKSVNITTEDFVNIKKTVPKNILTKSVMMQTALRKTVTEDTPILVTLDSAASLTN